MRRARWLSLLLLAMGVARCSLLAPSDCELRGGQLQGAGCVVPDGGAGEDSGAQDAGGASDSGSAKDAGGRPPDAGPSLVQQTSAVTTTYSPYPVTFDTLPQTGDLVTVLITSRDSAGGPAPLVTLSGLGASWHTVGDSAGASLIRSMMYAGTVVDPGTADAGISLVFSGATTPRVSASMQEWASLTINLDGALADGGVTTQFSPGTLVTTHGDDMVLVVAAHNLSEASVTAPTLPWAPLQETNATVPSLYAVYLLDAAPGPYEAQWSWANNNDNSGVIAAFRE